MPQQQTALAVTEIGKPVSKISRPIPEPRKGEVLIRVTVAGLNPHDAKAREGLFTKGHLPAILAADVVGVVTSVGPHVTRFKPGDRVFGQTTLLGEDLGGHFNFGPPNWDTAGLQEYAILETRFSAKVPAGFTDAEAATLPCNLVAAVVGLFDPSCLGLPAPWDARVSDFDYKGTSLLIIGGGANTGKFAIQAAAAVGVGNIIVVAGRRSAEEAKALGATHVIDRMKSSTEIAAEVREVVGEDLIYAFDMINPADSQHIGVEALSNTRPGKLARYEVLNVPGVSPLRLGTTVPLWEYVTGWAEDGKIKPTPFQVINGLDVDAVNKTLDGYSHGTTSGQWQVQF
ncbi:GroES-like protein [Penicillium chermesinum]|uniref:GroES-like protein n=1 Tax=Penicillium chermesinum TaxID=63820 RepID=A0A9W9TCU9_9EURO|nr:GroES-like protein [Penicillium chermesinum]KAJ5216920.1 GroES-like protein [Penicillium chermesinum]